MDLQFTPVEVRILGSLIEKEKTTPEYYPLTLNSLLHACNQKSNRDPVMKLSETEIENNIHTLKEKKLIWQVMTSGSRTPKYKHDVVSVFGFSDKQIAILTVLMLRGPQTVGEIKGHSVRLYPFASLEETEAEIEALIQDSKGPYIIHLPRQVGQKERRYGHLFFGADIINNMQDSTAYDGDEKIFALERRLATLEQELELLKEKINK